MDWTQLIPLLDKPRDLLILLLIIGCVYLARDNFNKDKSIQDKDDQIKKCTEDFSNLSQDVSNHLVDAATAFSKAIEIIKSFQEKNK